MLIDLIDNRIMFENTVSSWEDAICLGSKFLLEEGFFKQSYLDAMIDGVREFGPYIVLADGVAMPHARPEKGALKTGMSFLHLEKGVFFPKTSAPVQLFFTLSATDSDAHLEAVMELADLLGDDMVLTKMIACNNREEFLKILG